MPLDDHSRTNPDIRWKQRLSNYQRAYAQLAEAVELSTTRPLSRLEQQGLIQAFEFTHELAWQVMKDYFEYQGTMGITGSRDAMRAAFQAGLIEDGDGWMDTIKSRNRSSHTYDENTANTLAETIAKRYLPLFGAFKNQMETLAARET